METIRRDNQDILYFATNVTCVANLVTILAQFRLARIHVAGPGSVTTSGMRHMDYYVSGELSDPAPDAQGHYTEKLRKLRGAAHCFSYGTEVGVAKVSVTRAGLGASPGDVVFVSPANMNKLIPEQMDTMARILAGTARARLVLFPYGPHWQVVYPKALFEALLGKTLARHGLARDRVTVVDLPSLNREDIRELMRPADVCLDSMPFSGSTSLVEPLEAGVPVVTMQGDVFRSAMGAGLLRELGVPELVTGSEEAYIELACRLGRDEALCQDMRARIQERMAAKPRFLNSPAFGSEMAALLKSLMRERGLVE